MRIGNNRERIKVVSFADQADDGGGVLRLRQISTSSVFADSLVPQSYDNSPAPINVGMRFRVLQSGYITGIRFYKNPLNIGPHTGSLWSSDGTQLLAQVVFSGETASGWQTMLFSSPVAVTADTLYVVSYHTASGYNSVTPLGFDTAITGTYIEVPAYSDTVSSMYSYSEAPSFPGETNATSRPNLFVDVVYSDSLTANGESVYWETNAEVSELTNRFKFKTTFFEIAIEEAIEFKIRNRVDKTVTKFMQVIFKNRYYTIHGIMDAGYRGRELKLVCKMRN